LCFLNPTIEESLSQIPSGNGQKNTSANNANEITEALLLNGYHTMPGDSIVLPTLLLILSLGYTCNAGYSVC